MLSLYFSRSRYHDGPIVVLFLVSAVLSQSFSSHLRLPSFRLAGITPFLHRATLLADVLEYVRSCSDSYISVAVLRSQTESDNGAMCVDEPWERDEDPASDVTDPRRLIQLSKGTQQSYQLLKELGQFMTRSPDNCTM